MNYYVVRAQRGDFVRLWSGCGNWSLSDAKDFAKELKKTLKPFKITVEEVITTYSVISEI